MFTEREREYIAGQRLVRIATVSSGGQPDVSPVAYSFDGEQFLVGGHNNRTTRKFRNVQGGNRQVALVFDDLATVQPWQPRGLKVFGTAEIAERDGHFGPGWYLVITPQRHWSWGIEQSAWVDGEPVFQRGSFD